MNSTILARPSAPQNFLEALEDRIAPATITIGGDYAGNSQLTPTDGETADAAIKEFFGASDSHYYLKLNKGDKLFFDADGAGAGTASSWVEVKGGTAYLFLADDGDGIIQQNELSGLSVGGKASLTITTAVHGAIVANVDGVTGKFLGNTLADGAKNSIAQLSVRGDLHGPLLAAGSVSNVTVDGSVTWVRVGTAASEVSFDLGGDGSAGEGYTEAVVPGAKVVGASIKGLSAEQADQIVAGNGGAQAAGGSISVVALTSDSNGVVITAGSGGAGTAANLKGGAGGKVSGVTITGGGDSGAEIVVKGGAGGTGYFESVKKFGTGGAGGAVENVTLGSTYVKATKSWIPGEILLRNAIELAGGRGGDGSTAGAGGSVSGVAAFTQDAPISINGGIGGDVTQNVKGKDGSGGALSTITAVSTGTHENANSSVTLQAGNAGGGGNSYGAGGVGGSVSKAVVAAFGVYVHGGHGSYGTSGGAGGSISGIVSETSYVPLRNVAIFAGEGANGTLGNGGAGGSVSGVTFDTYFYNSSVYGDIPGGLQSQWVNGSDVDGNFTVESSPSDLGLSGGQQTYLEWLGISPEQDGSNFTLTEPRGNVSIFGSHYDEDSGEIFYLHDVTLDQTVYGDVELTSSITGSLSINEDVHGRILLHVGSFIPGDFTVTGGSRGVFIVDYQQVDEDGMPAMTPFTEADYATYVGGTVSLSELEPSGPNGIWTGGFSGDITVAVDVYGSVEYSGYTAGSLLISGDVYGKVFINESSYIAGDVFVTGANNGVFVRTFDPESGESSVVPILEYDYGTLLGGALQVSDEAPDGPQAWQVEGFHLDLHAGDGGKGGTLSSTGIGGAGGSITDSRLYSDPYPIYGLSGKDLNWVVTAGDGGTGASKGGAGGSLGKSYFSAVTTEGATFDLINFTAGDGGNAEVKGSGGAGGSIKGTGFYLHDGITGNEATVRILAGQGGAGADSGSGGAGGSVLKDGMNVNPYIGLNGQIQAGQGGDASTGAPGLGGSISGLTVDSYESRGMVDGLRLFEILAGNAGASESILKGAAGGSIKNVEMQGYDMHFDLKAGSGSAGGAGGNIENLTQKFTNIYEAAGGNYVLDPNFFSVVAKAGEGSLSGVGGSIKNVSLVAPAGANGSYPEGFAYDFFAGQGGSGVKPGAGGSIEKINILDTASTKFFVPPNKFKKVTGSFDYSLFENLGVVTLEAGNGGDSEGDANGAKGGDIKNVFWNLETLTRILAKGQGGASVGGSAGSPGQAINVNPQPV